MPDHPKNKKKSFLPEIRTHFSIFVSVSNRLFKEHSELLNLFNKFRELKTKEQQASSEELAEHANKVMETLDEGIRGIEELDAFFQFLHQIGGSHTRIPGFKAKYFWVSFFFFVSAIFFRTFFQTVQLQKANKIPRKRIFGALQNEKHQKKKNSFSFCSHIFFLSSSFTEN